MEFKIQNSKPNFRKLAIFLCLAIFAWIYSCASLRDWKVGRDNFSRTYAVDFMSFHAKLNSALQNYAQTHVGSSFQVALLGSDAVIIRGLYKMERSQDRFPIMITVKTAGPAKSRMEIKISASDPRASSDYLQEVARALFQIIEKGMGVRPQE